MTTATTTISPEHVRSVTTAQEKFRAALKTPRVVRFARAVPGEHPLETLRTFGAFTLYDWMTVNNLGRAHALITMHQALKDKQIEATPEPGRYLVVKPPCRAIQVWAVAPPQFAANYIRRFVLEQYAPMLDYTALIAAMSLEKVQECPF